MKFRSMKTLVLILVYMIGLGLTSGASFYKWSGSLNIGESIYVHGLTLTVDKNNATGELALIIRNSDEILGLLKAGESGEFQGLEISFNEFNGYGIVDISSEKPFTLSFTKEEYAEKLKQLEQENAALKAQNANLSQKISSLKAQVQKLQGENEKLKKQGQSAANTEQLNTKITQLEKENRELKAQLANLTTKYNQLKAKANFLEQQNDEYRQIIQQVMNEQSSQSKQNYIGKAKKERLIGSILWKSLIGSVVVVGLVGYGLYRKKRSWELGGL